MPKVGRKTAAKVNKASSPKKFTSELLVIAGLILIIALLVRFFGIMDVGITWDEPIYVKTALSYLDFLPKYGIFSNSTWQYNYEHPPLAKMIYSVAINFGQGFKYDLGAYYLARVASAIMGALTCVIVFLIGRDVYGKSAGILAGLIMALLPLAIAHSQIAGLETPLTFFFTLSVYLFLLAMRSGDRRIYALSAISVGLTIDTKLNGLLVLPVIVLTYAAYVYFGKKSPDWKKTLASGAGFLLIAGATLVLLWPWLWADFSTLTSDPLKPLGLTLSHWAYTPHEYFWGVFQAAPIYYLPVYFLVTTPLLVLALVAAGAYFTARGRDPYRLGILLWLIIPFFYGFNNMVQDGIRYILMIYPAIALLGAFGLSSAVTWVHEKRPSIGNKQNIFAFASIVLVLYLVVSLAMVRPYYLDYYNVLSGGQKNIAEDKLYEYGYWGEGIKQCVEYVESHAAPGTTVLLATLPTDTDHYGFYAEKMTYLTFSQTNGAVQSLNFSTKKAIKYDNSTESIENAWNAPYIIENTQFIDFGTDRLNLSRYTPVYTASLNGGAMCTVYKRK